MYAPAACLRQFEHHLDCCCCFIDIQITLSTNVYYHINISIRTYIHILHAVARWEGGIHVDNNCSKIPPVSRTLPVTLLPRGQPLSVKQEQVPACVIPRGVSCFLPYPLPGTPECIFVALIVSSLFRRLWPVLPRFAWVHLSCGECWRRWCTEPTTLPWILLPPPALACTTRASFCSDGPVASLNTKNISPVAVTALNTL